MESFAFRIPSLALTFALLAAPAVAFAQARAPTREGNVWGWRAHQPTEAQVQQLERVAGIAPTPFERESNATTMDRLNQQLLRRSSG